jgi:hypothetical protein
LCRRRMWGDEPVPLLSSTHAASNRKWFHNTSVFPQSISRFLLLPLAIYFFILFYYASFYSFALALVCCVSFCSSRLVCSVCWPIVCVRYVRCMCVRACVRAVRVLCVACSAYVRACTYVLQLYARRVYVRVYAWLRVCVWSVRPGKCL